MEQMTLCTGEQVLKPVFITTMIALEDVREHDAVAFVEAAELAANLQHPLSPGAREVLERYVLTINGEMPSDVRKIVAAAIGGSATDMYLKATHEVVAANQ